MRQHCVWLPRIQLSTATWRCADEISFDLWPNEDATHTSTRHTHWPPKWMANLASSSQDNKCYKPASDNDVVIFTRDDKHNPIACKFSVDFLAIDNIRDHVDSRLHCNGKRLANETLLTRTQLREYFIKLITLPSRRDCARLLPISTTLNPIRISFLARFFRFVCCAFTPRHALHVLSTSYNHATISRFSFNSLNAQIF